MCSSFLGPGGSGCPHLGKTTGNSFCCRRSEATSVLGGPCGLGALGRVELALLSPERSASVGADLAQLLIADESIRVTLRQLNRVLTPLVLQEAPDAPTAGNREQTKFAVTCLAAEEHQHLL